MRNIFPWQNINPGGHDPENDKLDDEIREILNTLVYPLMNFFFWASLAVIIAILGIFTAALFKH